MTLDPSTLTWTCMVCGDERPDALIGVAQHPVEHEGRTLPGTTYNMRYCLDRAACVTDAKTHGPYRLGKTSGPVY